jgi:cellulose synthase/poly-beta-1,6-N-acetylglucosamine synthase-like glycosyltransferase
MIWSLTFEQFAVGVATVIISIGLLQNAIYVVQIVLAAMSLSRNPPLKRTGALWERNAGVAPPISLLVPAYNEERSIVESVRSLLALLYPNIEVIVVNDGSTDGTMAALIKGFDLVPDTRPPAPGLPHKPFHRLLGTPDEPRLLVVDKENAGKADALNCAINFARSEIICVIDADSILERDALLRAVEPFIDDPERTVAVGATVRVANGCVVQHGHVLDVRLPRKLLALFQTIEYLRSFLMARLAWSHVGALTIVSGAFGLFRRQAVIDVGGYSTHTVGEDLELVIRLHRLMRDRGEDYRITFIPEPVCWTEVPETLRNLGRQRTRWQRGALETFFMHIDMMVKPRYGRIGSLSFLNMLLIDVISPIAEVLGYVLVPLFWGAGLLSIDYLLAFLSLTFAFGVAISAGALILEELELRRFPKILDLLRLVIAAVLENFGYRQLNNIWRVRGTFQFLRGKRSWGHLSRKGFIAAPKAEPEASAAQ